MMSLQQRKIPQWKKDEVRELTELLKTYNTVLIIDLNKFPADKFHEIRKKFRKNSVIKVSKNTLFRLAAKEAGIDVSKLDQYLTGTNGFLFSNDNPFTLALNIDKFKLKRYAVPGDIAEEEVVIPAGDTGMPAGPILSTFGKLKVQTRVQDGKIAVAKDTVIAKPGDPIPAEAIPILQKLGIMPVYIKLAIKAAYHEGLVIPKDQLVIKVDDYKAQVLEAYRNALGLGVEIAYPVPEVLKISLTKAQMYSLNLAGEIGFVTKETASIVFSKAMAKAYALAAAINDKANLGIQVTQKPAATEEKKEAKEEKKEEEEKKGPSEEEIAGGLSSLFG
ncbi:MAG: acidic ribosomal protein P0 [Candidatus Aramenus sulfurataquae]|jgi:large subunit ribosomal protein L10|uniref:Large ribosomal subunit protein uL10 n=2 Tax=Candidatus Aramenus sulfurataquae TaxID=1326980 RepID=W7KK54_9CREN|nr:MAG: acidic ribosomal protein P0 [Candidatus Aramenus sulfurataquae]MCL7343502.1 50S ribosomal protein L10 [Candidatus Aramenus sulfurataquae]